MAIKRIHPKHIHLSVRRWFDKRNGTGYFSAQILADGVLVAVIPFRYGYEYHPELEAARVLYGPVFNATPLADHCKMRGIGYSYDEANGLKRDVVAFGKAKPQPKPVRATEADRPINP